MVVGSQELREGALVPAGLDPTVLQMEPIMYCVLEAVAQFRQFGVFRPQLTQSFLKGKDARKAWHIVRHLARMQLVVVKVWLCARVSIQLFSSSNSCYLSLIFIIL